MKALLALAVVGTLPLQAGDNPVMKGNESFEKVISVGGHVRRPGPVKYSKGVTLYSAIQSAGGANEFGAVNRVKVLRDGKATLYDLRQDKQKLTPLQAGDLIELPQKNIFGK